MQGKPTQLKPYLVELDKDKNYAYCNCGLSATQPFCDGAHKGTGFAPTVFQVQEAKTYALCGCRHTERGPFCDGTHKNLKDVSID